MNRVIVTDEPIPLTSDTCTGKYSKLARCLKFSILAQDTLILSLESLTSACLYSLQVCFIFDRGYFIRGINETPSGFFKIPS
jgi:hypothetical protein